MMKIKKYYYVVIGLILFGITSLSFLSFYSESSSNLQMDDIKLAVTVDGVSKTQIPDKGSGKAVSSIVCDKNATG
ncbi:MAG: hypothetical protein HFI09_05275, partial [Bacilli bacterium]|nr:hypothetical protein [Bacilli bacterium]